MGRTSWGANKNNHNFCLNVWEFKWIHSISIPGCSHLLIYIHNNEYACGFCQTSFTPLIWNLTSGCDIYNFLFVIRIFGTIMKDVVELGYVSVCVNQSEYVLLWTISWTKCLMLSVRSQMYPEPKRGVLNDSF